MTDADFGFLVGLAVAVWVFGPLLWFAFNGYRSLSRENRRLRERLDSHDDIHGDLTRLPN